MYVVLSLQPGEAAARLSCWGGAGASVLGCRSGLWWRVCRTRGLGFGVWVEVIPVALCVCVCCIGARVCQAGRSGGREECVAPASRNKGRGATSLATAVAALPLDGVSRCRSRVRHTRVCLAGIHNTLLGLLRHTGRTRTHTTRLRVQQQRACCIDLLCAAAGALLLDSRASGACVCVRTEGVCLCCTRVFLSPDLL